MGIFANGILFIHKTRYILLILGIQIIVRVREVPGQRALIQREGNVKILRSFMCSIR